jgi:hypothetical protein
MRYGKLDAGGDYCFGGGATDFLVNTPETVAQAVLTPQSDSASSARRA